TAIRRSVTGGKEEARSRRELTALLVALKLERCFKWAAANRLSGSGAVKRLPLQVVEHILRRIILCAPTGVFLVADVNVYVHHCGHHGLASQIHMGCASGYFNCEANRSDKRVLDDKRAVLNRRAPVTGD